MSLRSRSSVPLTSSKRYTPQCVLPSVFLVFLVGLAVLYRPGPRHKLSGVSDITAAAVDLRVPSQTTMQQQQRQDLQAWRNMLESVNTSLLPLAVETFLYLSTGPNQPSTFTVQRGCLPASAVIFLTFRAPVSLGRKANCNCTTVHFPRGSWVTRRNKLIQEAFLLEQDQGWRYEFFVFIDDDIRLLPYANAQSATGGDADMLFRALLVKYRALRSSVPYGVVPLKPLKRSVAACARACFSAAYVDAYHRTGVDLLLPYASVLDKLSWYMSAYIVNLLVAAIAPGHCHIYRQLGAARRYADREHYPRGQGDFDQGIGWTSARQFVNWQLVASKVPGFRANESLAAKIQTGLFGSVVSGKEEECQVQSQGVDYAKLIPYRVL